MKKVMLIFGTRPEAIKMCPLIRELKTRRGISTSVCVTGQHRHMLDSVLEEFGVTPDVDLDIMTDAQSLNDITAAVLSRLKPVLCAEKPDIVLVHGDTTTAFAAALACFYMQIPVGHVEAGLRTYDNTAPYPEEFNRQAIGAMSSIHFAPTGDARDNLLREGKKPHTVFVTGNTVIDAIKLTADTDTQITETAGRLILITAHRRESIGEPLRGMLRAIRRVVDEDPDVSAVYPVHPNPAVRESVYKELGGCERIHLTDTLSAGELHRLEADCYLCLTDSGGIQEECAALGKPVLVMRDVTERKELIKNGSAQLSGTDEQAIYESFKRLLDDPEAYAEKAGKRYPCGDGNASRRIADVLEYGSCDEWL